MKLRTRFLLLTVIAVLGPLAVLLLVVRQEMGSRLTAEYRTRVSTLIETAERSLSEEEDRLWAGMGLLEAELGTDPRIRQFLSGDSDLASVVPFAAALAADRADVDWFVLQDAEVVLAYGLALGQGSADGGLIAIPQEAVRAGSAGATRAGGADALAALITGMHPDNPGQARVGADQTAPVATILGARDVLVDGRALRLVSGRWLGPDFWSDLAPDPAMAAGLVVDGDLTAGTSTSGLSRDLPVGWLQAGAVERASLRVAHSLGDLQVILDSLDRWFTGAFLAMALMGLGGAWYAASQVTRPIEQLTEATAGVELDRASPRFLAVRRDEIGRLSRTMESMVRRMRSSAAQVRAAERKAALGDFARQANHDIKNGLTPIANVVAHLGEATDDPGELARIFAEREKSLQSGIAYLRELSGAYGRISSRSEARMLDAVPLVRETVASLAAADPRIRFSGAGSAHLQGDPLGVRRIVENLVTNAQDSLGSNGGRIDVSVSHDDESVFLKVRDNGPGIPTEVQDRLFEDFFTTRATGAGLGLSIVRRLVLDLNGSVRVASSPGEGAEFIVEIPAAAKT